MAKCAEHKEISVQENISEMEFGYQLRILRDALTGPADLLKHKI